FLSLFLIASHSVLIFALNSSFNAESAVGDGAFALLFAGADGCCERAGQLSKAIQRKANRSPIVPPGEFHYQF
ncbi:MAG: hypothetical protein WAM69_19300, partial [Candidatus Sulfotelmatobacter sp.]